MPVVPDDGWIGSWAPGIGDPTIVGWLTVLLYLIASWQCWRLSAQPSRLMRRERQLYRILALGLLALGLNKQLDLQSAVTEIGRIIARDNEWYDYRRPLQLLFISFVAAAAVAASLAVIVLMRKAPWPTRGAVAGAVALLGFVVIRAASFHRFDHFIGIHWLGVRVNAVLEIGSISAIVAFTRRRTMSVTRKPSTRTPRT